MRYMRDEEEGICYEREGYVMRYHQGGSIKGVERSTL